MWSVYQGGVHAGGAFFVVLHIPSSILFGYIAQTIGSGSLILEVLYVLLTTSAQYLLFTVVAYWLQRLLLKT